MVSGCRHWWRRGHTSGTRRRQRTSRRGPSATIGQLSRYLVALLACTRGNTFHYFYLMSQCAPSRLTERNQTLVSPLLVVYIYLRSSALPCAKLHEAPYQHEPLVSKVEHSLVLNRFLGASFFFSTGNDPISSSLP